MKIDITYTSTKHYDRTNITQWIWMFKRHKHVKGFIMRIFGIYINVRENNATEKLITKARNMKVIKLICVDNKNSLSLTLGKEYCAYVITAGNTYYRLFNDKGKINSYTTDLFMTLEEYRNKRLEELGI